MPRPLGRPRHPTDRGRHRDPRGRRALTQAQPQPTEDAVAVVVRTGRTRPRPMLACLPAPLRHRAHLPLRQEHPRLDHTGAADPRPSRPLDLAGRRRLHPTAPGPRARRRPTPALGTTPRPRQAHTRARPQRVSPTPPNPGHTSQCAEIRQTRTRAPKKHPPPTPNPLPSSQESRMKPGPRFNRKLMRTMGMAANARHARPWMAGRALGWVTQSWRSPIFEPSQTSGSYFLSTTL